jgi:hypothetical protein
LLFANSIAGIFVVAIYVAISVSPNPSTQGILAGTGVAICMAFVIIIACCFAVYGLLLVRSLTRDFSSQYATGLLSLTIAFSVVLISESILELLQLFYVGSSSLNYDLINVTYYAVDVSGLFLVMIMFKKSVSDYRNSGSRVSNLILVSSKSPARPSQVTPVQPTERSQRHLSKIVSHPASTRLDVVKPMRPKIEQNQSIKFSDNSDDDPFILPPIKQLRQPSSEEDLFSRQHHSIMAPTQVKTDGTTKNRGIVYRTATVQRIHVHRLPTISRTASHLTRIGTIPRTVEIGDFEFSSDPSEDDEEA